jgi:GT2 family glycosyltransferase
MSYKPETGAERYIENAGLYEPKNSVDNTDIPFVVGMNLAVRRQAALSIGGWAEDLIRAEDIDFSYRLTKKFGTTITYQERAIIFHRNRRTDQELMQQATGYGYGAALMYKRYPGELKWGWSETLKLAALLGHRVSSPLFMGLKHKFGRVSDDHLEFAKYNRMWSMSFWTSFLKTYYSKQDRGLAQ